MNQINYRSLCVMLVDDDPVQRAVVKAMLKKLGTWQIFESENGHDAEPLIKVAEPDLLICDVAMEPVNGFELLRRLRTMQSAKLRQIPVIMLSGLSASGTVMKASVLEADAYVVKPIVADVLSDRISRVMRTPNGSAFRIDRSHLTDNKPSLDSPTVEDKHFKPRSALKVAV